MTIRTCACSSGISRESYGIVRLPGVARSGQGVRFPALAGPSPGVGCACACALWTRLPGLFLNFLSLFCETSFEKITLQ